MNIKTKKEENNIKLTWHLSGIRLRAVWCLMNLRHLHALIAHIRILLIILLLLQLLIVEILSWVGILL